MPRINEDYYRRTAAQDLAAFGYGFLAFLAINAAFIGFSMGVFKVFEEDITAKPPGGGMSNAAGIFLLATVFGWFVCFFFAWWLGIQVTRCMDRKMSRAATPPGMILGCVGGLAIVGTIGLIVLAALTVYLFAILMMAAFGLFGLAAVTSK